MSRSRRPAPRRSGFTMVELATVLTLAMIIVPTIYVLGRDLEDRAERGQWHLQTADGVRTVAEELRRDAREGALLAGPDLGFTVHGCEVRYPVQDGVLLRQASADCGGARGLATRVESLQRVGGGVELRFVRVLQTGHPLYSTVFLPLPPASP